MSSRYNAPVSLTFSAIYNDAYRNNPGTESVHTGETCNLYITQWVRVDKYANHTGSNTQA